MTGKIYFYLNFNSKIMYERTVIFNTAKLAKEKGFNEPCMKAYRNSEILFVNPFAGKGLLSDEHWFTNYENGETLDNYHTIPTQSFLQKWLREKHKINISIDSADSGTRWIFKAYSMKSVNDFYQWGIVDSFENTLEIALVLALKSTP